MQRIQESAADIKKKSGFPLNCCYINGLSSVTVPCSSFSSNHLLWELYRALLCVMTAHLSAIDKYLPKWSPVWLLRWKFPEHKVTWFKGALCNFFMAYKQRDRVLHTGNSSFKELCLHLYVSREEEQHAGIMSSKRANRLPRRPTVCRWKKKLHSAPLRTVTQVFLQMDPSTEYVALKNDIH